MSLPGDDDYHGAAVVYRNKHMIVVELDFVGAIGLYKMSLGIDDDDSQKISAALQVQLAGIVGP